MGWLEGLLGGFSERKADVEKMNLAEAEKSNKREADVYQTLLSSPNPDVQAMAATGLLQSAGPRKRKSGLQGWMGQFQDNPMYDQIRSYIDTSTQTPTTRASGQITKAPAAEAPAGTPAHSLTEPGAPAATPPEPTPPPASVGAPPPAGPAAAVGLPPGGRAPNNPFQSPSEGKLAEAAAAEHGKLIGLQQGVNDLTGGKGMSTMSPETRSMLMQFGILRTPPAPTFGGTARFEDLPPEEQAKIEGGGKPGQVYRRSINRMTGEDTYEPVTPTSMIRPSYQTLADPENGNRPTRYAVYSDGTRKRLGALADKEQNVTITHQDGSQEIVRIPPLYVGGGAGAPAAAGRAGAPLVGTPPPTSAAPPAAPAAAPAAPAGGSQGRVGVSGGAGTGAGVTTRAAQYEPVQGARIGADGSVSEAVALHNPKGPGSYLHPETGEVLNDFVPGKIGDATIETLAKAQQTNSLIDRALAALAPVKNDNTRDGTLKFATKYRAGTSGDDPVSAAQAALSDLAGLQVKNSAALRGGSRAYQYITSISQHVPILPSPRETAVSRVLPSSLVATTGQLLENTSSWDSPAAMYQKLQLARKNNQQFVDELKSGLGKTASATGRPSVGAPPPQPAPTPPAVTIPPNKEYEDNQGNIWRGGPNGQPVLYKKAA